MDIRKDGVMKLIKKMFVFGIILTVVFSAAGRVRPVLSENAAEAKKSLGAGAVDAVILSFIHEAAGSSNELDADKAVSAMKNVLGKIKKEDKLAAADIFMDNFDFSDVKDMADMYMDGGADKVISFAEQKLDAEDLKKAAGLVEKYRYELDDALGILGSPQ